MRLVDTAGLTHLSPDQRILKADKADVSRLEATVGKHAVLPGRNVSEMELPRPLLCCLPRAVPKKAFNRFDITVTRVRGQALDKELVPSQHSYKIAQMCLSSALHALR